MTEITFHRGRMPGEPDIFEVKTSSRSCWSGKFYFEKIQDDMCKLAEVEMNKEYKKEDYIIQAAKTLIREKDMRVVYNDIEAVIAKMAVGSEYE